MVNMSRSVRRAGINVPAGAQPSTPQEGRAFDTPWNAVSSHYFTTMGVPLLQGRVFTDAESFIKGASPIAIVDEALAGRLWPGETAVGQRLELVGRERPAGEAPTVFDIVGVVGSTRRQLYEKELPGALYVPFAQGATGNAYFHVRPRAAQAGLADTVRREIRSAAPGLPLFNARTYAEHVGSSVEYWTLRLTAALFAAFGGLAMVVAIVGIYGVMSYTVIRRTREIGIRMAVGAMPRAVSRMILAEGLKVTLLGIAAGLLAGAGVGRVMGTLFVDVAPLDPLTFTLVPLGFLTAALIAAWLPARRATRVNPVTALRSE
jgi:hypothetical protein